MSERKRLKLKNKKETTGMFSISDMFKKQNESQKRQNQTSTKLDIKQGDKKNLTLSIDDDSDIEIIDGDTESKDVEYSGIGVELTSPQSRLSLKRKHVSTVDANIKTKICDNHCSKYPYNESNVCDKKDFTPVDLAESQNRSSEDRCSGEREIEVVIEMVNKGVEIEQDSASKEKETEHSDDIKKLPYYLNNFETILSTVVEDADVETLFNDVDHTFINSFRALSEQAEKLYVRLFGRKFQWIPLSKIKYTEIADDLIPYFKELTDACFIYDENNLTDLRNVLETLPAGDVKTLAKLYHVAPTKTQKKEIIKELIRFSQRNTIGSMFGSKGGVLAAMLKKAKSLVNGAYKLQSEARSVFIRVMMLFSLVNTTGDEESSNGGQGQLFQMLMVNMGKVVYPNYKIEKKHKIFKNREDVIRFELALQTESDLLHSIERGDWTGAYDIYCVVSRQLEELQQDKEITV